MANAGMMRVIFDVVSQSSAARTLPSLPDLSLYLHLRLSPRYWLDCGRAQHQRITVLHHVSAQAAPGQETRGLWQR